MKRSIWLVLGLLAPLSTAQAASFDCSKAASTVEKLICGDDELSKMDETLSKTYLQTDQSGDHQKATREQRQWLKDKRNACLDEKCLKSAYTTRINELATDNTLVRFKGKWVGYSTNIRSIFGNLTVRSNELDFEREGKRSFKIFKGSEESVILELTESLNNCGRFVRLGPIKKEGSPFAGFMEFSIFVSKEKSLAAKYFNDSEMMDFTDYCNWGLYSR